MTTEATQAAMALGYTVPVYIDGDFGGFDALVRPDTDYDDRFKAWDLDDGGWMSVNGWMCTIHTDGASSTDGEC